MDTRHERHWIGMAVTIDGGVQPLRLTRAAATGALVLFAAALLSETARAFGFMDTNTRVVRASFFLFTMLAVGAAIIEHYIAATRELQRLNTELERRLIDKAREVAAHSVQAEEAMREQALARERSRILADMHDGVGASLIGLLRHVQSGSADRASIERRVQETMQEMRIAVDALQPRGGDLAAVLGNLRYRIDDTIRASGMQLAWDMEELPDVGELEPAAVFSLQRILLEAITNALKHSGAQSVCFSARAQDREVVITLADNGRGFDSSRPAAGLGLLNMRARAQSIGARLEIHSRPGSGTAMQLYLPLKVDESTSGNISPAPESAVRGAAGRTREAA